MDEFKEKVSYAEEFIKQMQQVQVLPCDMIAFQLHEQQIRGNNSNTLITTQ